MVGARCSGAVGIDPFRRLVSDVGGWVSLRAFMGSSFNADLPLAFFRCSKEVLGRVQVRFSGEKCSYLVTGCRATQESLSLEPDVPRCRRGEEQCP